MRTTRIEVCGNQGKAMLQRENGGVEIWIVVSKAGINEGKGWFLGGAASTEDRTVVARELHRLLEGFDGTNGDIADYQNAINLIAG